ncbi:MAG: hypothetical protein ACI9R3_006195, partial [Verrucomicrobiales bacterium]
MTLGIFSRSAEITGRLTMKRLSGEIPPGNYMKHMKLLLF